MLANFKTFQVYSSLKSKVDEIVGAVKFQNFSSLQFMKKLKMEY